MSHRKTITWVLEDNIFPNGDCLAAAARAAGHRVIAWSDEWWSNQSWPEITEPCVFHGSLGNADRIPRELPWKPGSFCNTAAFSCSYWYDSAREFLLHPKWRVLSANDLVERSDEVFEDLGGSEQLFVRPDSPLKPFSGRVVSKGKLTLAALDHGFYYDDPNIAVVAAPVQSVLHEWRFVVADQRVITGSGYLATGRQAEPNATLDRATEFASCVAKSLPAPERLYVLDVCETPQGLRLLELNPFSGADLYACDGEQIVLSVANMLEGD